MSHIAIAGRRLHYELAGSGQPVVLVHGSWDDRSGWDPLVPLLSSRLHVLRYDRRGHGRSDGGTAAGALSEDVEDLARLLWDLGHAPAHVVGHSYGATVALLLAARHPRLCRGVTVHEPPLFGMLADTPHNAEFDDVRERAAKVAELLGAGEREVAARMFIDEVGFGPGTWDGELDARRRSTFTTHGPVWLARMADPEPPTLRAEHFAEISTPVLLTRGDHGLPWYRPIIDLLADAIPGARKRTLHGCGHAPQNTHPREYAAIVTGEATAPAEG
ncbi:alpha/beta hydrolase [Saccharopolyspora erythraea]|uniref:alpha/beta fold hydrolase n=1 Tax=Saccharopolyspora erythraea TaxID=1836 RepID=UPI001BAA140A|nr:alpha/beta hydrolase [Saccharopolyspora erythraea]QUH02507.1 alpha/beta hydrolase [Saccharopolyspora erythraea]